MTTTCKHPPQAFRDIQEGDGTPQEKGRAAPDKNNEPVTAETGSRLVCKACRSRITRRELGMEIDGSQRHVFFNPQGDVFEVGCFASAKNVLPTGPRTDEFTWFPGYEWQAVACTGCLSHLGWRYTGEGGGFFGLILIMLAEELGTKP